MAEWTRQQYLDLMSFRPVPRPMFVELFGPLVGLEEEWRAQGASDAECDLSAFGFDRVRLRRLPVTAGIMGSASELLEDTPDYAIQRDRYGRRMRLNKGVATIALPLDHPVACMDDWRALKQRYAFCEERFPPDWDGGIDDDTLVVLGLPGGFDEARQLLGEEALCIAVHEEPELIHDILTTITGTVLAVLERVFRSARVDVISIHEDMAGRSGPLFGPRQVREFVAPYYRSVADALHANGGHIVSQDSDGDMRPVIDAFLDAGVNCMYPFEPAAGMDMVAARQRYGERLAIKGGIDKFALRSGRAAIDRELADKLQPCMQRGTVFGLDHRIPGGVPLDDYRYYVSRARELLGLDPYPEPGWQRMAF